MSMKLLFGMIGLALTAFFGYHHIYMPAEQQVQGLREQIAQAQATQQTQADVTALLARVERYRARGSPEPDPSWLVREVVALSEQAGVQVTTIAQDIPQEFPQFTRLSVALHVSASYHQLGAFLDRLEHGAHFIRVDQLNLTAGQTKGQPATAHLTLSALYLPAAVK